MKINFYFETFHMYFPGCKFIQKSLNLYKTKATTE